MRVLGLLHTAPSQNIWSPIPLTNDTPDSSNLPFSKRHRNLRPRTPKSHPSTSSQPWPRDLIANFWRTEDPEIAEGDEDMYQEFVARLRGYGKDICKKKNVSGRVESSGDVGPSDAFPVDMEGVEMSSPKAGLKSLDEGRVRKRTDLDNTGGDALGPDGDGEGNGVEYAHKKQKLIHARLADLHVHFAPVEQTTSTKPSGSSTTKRKVEESPDGMRKKQKLDNTAQSSSSDTNEQI